ncbi:protein FAR1-RELATED SEQUENCE 2 isoform X2 [Jatropha curcas]|uniref:protein FAR1-RELATED SEQUENCE 2 isoform X2 n=1 Tax=Jatropha curcas TaxID=180498 RepID=UPI0005FACAEF|nr:protein FAR1-RELATED SEQUENCE 2 isoform X2 [Jatropha curcas]
MGIRNVWLLITLARKLTLWTEKLDTGSNTNIDAMDSADGLHVSDEEIKSPASEQVARPCVPNENEHCTTSGENVEGNSIRAVASKHLMCEPRNGLVFETKEAAYSFYRDYARFVGFGITIKASRRSKKSGNFIDVKIACSRFGSKRESSVTVNPRSCIKTDCKAGMHMKRTQDGKWVIYSFIREHNHEIFPDDFHNSVQGRNKQSGVVACQKTGLQLALEENDMQVMLDYFMCMQAENPNFFYSLDLDHQNRLRNVFWVDAKGRNDYSFFCDVVFFDTFYLRSNYKVPYASIIGINNHCQFILLGCSLIGEQSVSTFVWLMQTWRKAMGDRAPNVIITEQDKCLNEAVADVFPDTHHCFCLWHILSKMPENLSRVMDEGEAFMSIFNKCIYRSWTDVQFEKRWWKMVDKFELRQDEWFRSLYEDRKKWVPTYMQDIFLAGMSTTERHGSIASFFDNYIHREATFKEFMELYKKFLQDRIKMEAKADFETRNKQPALRSHSAIEKQISRLYTESVFKKFQVEVLGVVSCQLQKESEDGATVNFRVDDFEKQQDFVVSWNETASDIRCLCRSFDYRGFLCKHAILVLHMSGISNIPSRYILKRWTKDAKTTQVLTEVSNGIPYRAQHFNDLCRRAIKLCEAGSLSQEAYHIAFKALEEILERCAGVNNSIRSVLEPNTLAVHGFLDIEEENRGNSITKSIKKKKICKKKKVLTVPEGMTIGLQDNYQQLDQINSRTHATGNCYVPQQDMQDMEMGSRATTTFDGFYGSQHSIRGAGQLDSVSPIRDDYYSNQQGLQGLLHSIPTCVNSYVAQQSMPGLGQLGFRAPTEQDCFEIHNNSQDMGQPVGSTQYPGISPKLLHDKRL